MCVISVVAVPIRSLLPVTVTIHKLTITPLSLYDQFNLQAYPVVFTNWYCLALALTQVWLRTVKHI
jgi:hypothetical protein